MVKRQTLVNALIVAADQYLRDASGLRDLRGDYGQDSVIAQFERQSVEARALADEIEQSETLSLED